MLARRLKKTSLPSNHPCYLQGFLVCEDWTAHPFLKIPPLLLLWTANKRSLLTFRWTRCGAGNFLPSAGEDVFERELHTTPYQKVNLINSFPLIQSLTAKLTVTPSNTNANVKTHSVLLHEIQTHSFMSPTYSEQSDTENTQMCETSIDLSPQTSVSKLAGKEGSLEDGRCFVSPVFKLTVHGFVHSG